MQHPPFLEVNNLSLGFKSEGEVRMVLKGVSFSVYSGQTTAIVGESGSGKSVSSLSLMNLLPKNKVVYDAGEFVFDGNDKKNQLAPGSLALEGMRGGKIAMIFQEPMTSLNPVMTCGEQIVEMLELHTQWKGRDAEKRAVELFKEVLLPRPEQMFGQYPHQLSGGQRQRVMIAMAIAAEPALLIADEPTTALDVTVQASILELLKNLQTKYGMAMIFITHDLGVVKAIANYIVVMKNGEVVETGDAKQVLNHPNHTYTKGLLECKPIPGVKLDRLKTMNAEYEPKVLSDFSEDKKDVLISIKGLSKQYIKSTGIVFKKQEIVQAVHPLTFDIYAGETLGVVGESGCGKTTLSRMLLGLIPASGGEVTYQQEDLTKLNASQWKSYRKDLQIIFQDPYSALNPKHTVGDLLMEPLIVLGLHRNAQDRLQRVYQLLDQVGLPRESVNRYPHEFSGGQRQRIVIARALSVEPRFIICDESVAALDVSVQAQVLNLLNDLKKELGLTYLFISHDLSVVYHMSDRIMVMNKGKIEEMGTAQQVYHAPVSEYTKKLLGSVMG
jgi:peptide/nickel transport system ATP-binding protein